MKRIYILLTAILYFQSYGQDRDTQIIQAAIDKTEKTKSGNYKDIFYTFYQMLGKNLTSDDKTLEFNSTFFQLKAIMNPELKRDINYINESFSRNLQFNLKANFNDNFQYEGFTGGITYTLINGRDATLVAFGEKYSNISNGLVILQSSIDTIETNLIRKINSNSSLSSKSKEDKIADVFTISRQLKNREKLSIEDTALLNEYKHELKQIQFKESDPRYKNLTDNGIYDLKTLVDSTYSYIDSFYKDIELKPLWTFAGDGTTNTLGKFNQASISSVFLVGNSFGELDARAKFSYADTISGGPVRTNINGKLGYNFKILKRKDNSSFFEIKLYGEYNKILRNPLPDEDEETWLADADIRLRITDDVWLPLTIKYDTDNSNFLGFLNVTYNFGDD